MDPHGPSPGVVGGQHIQLALVCLVSREAARKAPDIVRQSTLEFFVERPSLIIFVCCARPRCRHLSTRTDLRRSHVLLPRCVEQQVLLPCPSRSARSLPRRMSSSAARTAGIRIARPETVLKREWLLLAQMRSHPPRSGAHRLDARPHQRHPARGLDAQEVPN